MANKAADECPVTTQIEVALLQKTARDLEEDIKVIKADVKLLVDERASMKAWAAGVIAAVTFIVVSVNAIAASGVVSKVQELIDRRPPAATGKIP